MSSPTNFMLHMSSLGHKGGVLGPTSLKDGIDSLYKRLVNPPRELAFRVQLDPLNSKMVSESIL